MRSAREINISMILSAQISLIIFVKIVLMGSTPQRGLWGKALAKRDLFVTVKIGKNYSPTVSMA